MNSRLSNRYLVSADEPSALTQVIDNLRADPSVELLDTIGPPQAPHTAVVNMNDEQAAGLRRKFGAAVPGLLIEPDQPLSPLGDGG